MKHTIEPCDEATAITEKRKAAQRRYNAMLDRIKEDESNKALNEEYEEWEKELPDLNLFLGSFEEEREKRTKHEKEVRDRMEKLGKPLSPSMKGYPGDYRLWRDGYPSGHPERELKVLLYDLKPRSEFATQMEREIWEKKVAVTKDRVSQLKAMK